MSKVFAVLVALVCVFSGASVAHAQAWPQKPVRLIVPFPPGGGNDLIGRIVAQSLTKRLGQTVIVDNRPGANGIIGLQGLKQVPADGYTFATSSDGPLAINSAIYENLPYDMHKDFAPLALAIRQPIVMAIHPSMPVRSMRELVALARSRPDAISYSSAGVGNISHLSAELLVAVAGIKLLHVPYKGGEAQTLAVRSGEVQAMFGTVQNVIQQVRAGKLVIIGTGELAGKRLPVIPEVPAIADTLPGYESSTWNGFIAPINTPRDIAERLSREIRAIMEEKEVIAQVVAVGATPAPLGGAEFGALIRRDSEKWARLAKARNIRAE